MARVTLEGVRKIYDGPKPHVAVHGVDLAIGDGEFVVLVGPSGCGKSTTLRMIAGLESISAGRLSIDERVVNDVPAKDRDIAMVFQNYALYPHMSVYENMAFALRMRHVAKAEIDTRVREAAEVLGLTAVLERRPAQLSGGQRQRVALGRAIVRQPKVFLFDEPLSNLDAKLRVQMRREISRLHQRLGVTMVYVTHDQVEAMTLGERIVVLNAGHVQQIATPLELYDQPRNRFVAGFIGSPAMNFVEGELVRDEGVRFVGAGGAVRVALDPAAHPALAERSAGPLTLGVRPEDVAVRDASDVSADARIRVDLVEPMGHETYVYGHAGEQELTARIAPAHQPRVGAEMGCAFDRRKLHFFDPTSGDRVY